MNLINQNPFRVLGLSVVSSEREIQKQITKTKRFAEVNKKISFDTDFLFLGSFQRDLTSISNASSALEQPINRLLHSLFWFWNENHIDAAAFDNLSKENVDKAIEIWEKVVKDGEVSSKNLSCLFNLKSLYIAHSLKNNSIDTNEFIKGVILCGKFINHKDLDGYTNQVSGDHIKISSEELEIKFITSIYEIVKPFLGKSNGISTDEFLSGFKTFSKKASQHITAIFTGDPIKKIEDQIETTSDLRENNPIDAISFGETLYKNTKPQIKSLSEILGVSNVSYQIVAEKLASEILQCGIDFFNKIREDRIACDQDGIKSLNLCKVAMEISSSGQSGLRIKESIEFMEDWIKDAPNKEQVKGHEALDELQKLMEQTVKLLSA